MGGAASDAASIDAPTRSAMSATAKTAPLTSKVVRKIMRTTVCAAPLPAGKHRLLRDRIGV